MSKNALGSLFFLAFSSFYFFNVFSIKKMPISQFEIMTASSFPYYLGISGIIVSILIFIFSLKSKNNDNLTLAYIKTLDIKTTFYFILTMLFYGFTIRSLGFIFSTIIFLAMGFLLLKERNLKKILIISIVFSITFYFLLNNVLGVYLEPGIIIDYFIGDQSWWMEFYKVFQQHLLLTIF